MAGSFIPKQWDWNRHMRGLPAIDCVRKACRVDFPPVARLIEQFDRELPAYESVEPSDEGRNVQPFGRGVDRRGAPDRNPQPLRPVVRRRSVSRQKVDPAVALRD